MAQGAERTLVVTFGPSRAPSLPRAIAMAAGGAGRLEHEVGVHRASYVLGDDAGAYLHAHQLLGIVGSWKATTVQVDGRPERCWNVSWMLSCAAEQLTRSGRCQAVFRTRELPGRCRACPLYSPEWALESWGGIDGSFFLLDDVPYAPIAPESVPGEWVAEHPDAAERVRDQDRPGRGDPPPN